MQRQHVLRTDFFVSGQNKKLARKTLEKLLHYISSMIRVNTGKWSINNKGKFSLALLHHRPIK